METVVGVAGRKVTLPCQVEAADRRGVEVCWGKGKPSLFTCHNAVINAAGGQVSFRESYRYSSVDWGAPQGPQLGPLSALIQSVCWFWS